MSYLGTYMTQYMPFPIRPFRSILEFAFLSFFLASITTVVLSVAFLWRWTIAAQKLRRPTRLYSAMVLVYHSGCALFLILAWVESL